MVLENGSQFHLDCCCCQVGYDGPRGWVIQREVWFKPEVAIVAGVDPMGMKSEIDNAVEKVVSEVKKMAKPIIPVVAKTKSKLESLPAPDMPPSGFSKPKKPYRIWAKR